MRQLRLALGLSLLLATSLVAAPVRFAIGFVASESAYNGGSGDLTFAIDVGAGADRILVVGVMRFATNDVTGVTFNGDAFTQIGSAQQNDVGSNWVSMWYLVNPDSGSHNVVVSATSSTHLMGGAIALTGAAQTGQPDSFASGSSSNCDAAGEVTQATDVLAANSWLVMLAGTANLESTTAGTGATEREDISGQLWMGDSNGGVAAGSRSLAVNYSGIVVCGTYIASIAPAGGAPASNVPALINSPIRGGGR